MRTAALASHVSGVPLAAATDTITKRASTIGLALLAAAVVIALVVAFFSNAQRRWLTALTIVLIGGFVAMIVGDPQNMMIQVGKALQDTIWNPLMSTLGGG